MKTNSDKWQVTGDMKNRVQSRHASRVTHHAFTLIELLVVISIMAVLAAFTIPVLGAIKASQYKKIARGEMELIQTALENYKAKYGVYPPGNHNIPAAYAPANTPSQFSQLYYELSGVTRGGGSFTTLDGMTTITEADFLNAYGVGGVVNCTQGSGEDAAAAKNFLSGLAANKYNQYVTNRTIRTTMLVTSVGGPDDNYKPLLAIGLNPFRYVYPGVNNPNSYDLWVQLVIRGKTNLLCNWNSKVIINSPLP
jgi:prepilin-type N-terminal cleavage/methylation domain-containing protein